jgi:hypothetical protein
MKKKGIMLLVTDCEIKHVNEVAVGTPMTSLGYSTDIQQDYNVIILKGSEARVEVIKEPVIDEDNGLMSSDYVLEIVGALVSDHGNRIPSDKLVEMLK